MDQTLVEAEIAQAVLNFPVFHQEGAVAGHAGDDLLVGINFADVPQPRDQHAALGRGDHLIESLRILRQRRTLC